MMKLSSRFLLCGTERAHGQGSSLPQPDVGLGGLDEGEQALEERELVVPGQGGEDRTSR